MRGAAGDARSSCRLSRDLMRVPHDDPGAATLGCCDDQTEFEFGLDLMVRDLGLPPELTPISPPRRCNLGASTHSP